MTPFHAGFPDVAARETRSIEVIGPEHGVPAGQYCFIEHYCPDPACDCRQVLLQVITPQAPDAPLATINYGWENERFYAKRLHEDAEAAREIVSASLDPLHRQSRHAEWFLALFRDIVRNDPEYVARLARHYDMFKHALADHAAGTHPPEVHSPPTAAPMTIPEILRQLQHVPDKTEFAPYEAALRAAAEHREAITPELIAAIDRVSADPKHYLKNHSDCLHLFAIYLLAQFRETRALDCFLRFFSLPGEAALDLTGDMVTEHGAAVLASVCGGDPAPLFRLIRDDSVNMFVRTQALDALAVQNLWGERPREAVIEDLRGLFHTLAKPGNPFVWAGLIGVLHEFNVPELLPEARQAFAEELVDESVIGLEDIDPAVARPPRALPVPSPEERLAWFRERNGPIDAVAECSGWLCFRDEEKEGRPWKGAFAKDREMDGVYPRLPDDMTDLPKPEPFVAPPKVGRNDPCPCGSGKKYKKCCGK